MRVLLPKKVRTLIGDAKGLFLTPGTDQCLELHTSVSLEAVAAKANRFQGKSKNVRSFSRLFYAQAECLELDSQGRIRIPSRLAELADLEKEIALVGVGFHWEIWNADRWKNFLNKHQLEFDGIHERTFDSEPQQSPSENLTHSLAKVTSKTNPK